LAGWRERERAANDDELYLPSEREQTRIFCDEEEEEEEEKEEVQELGILVS